MSESPRLKNEPFKSSVYVSPDEVFSHSGTAFHREDIGDRYRALPLYTDSHGRSFFKLTSTADASYTKRSPHLQAMVSMLVSGVIQAAQVVPVKKKHILDSASETQRRPDYYSHLVPYEEIMDTKGNDAARADMLLLEALFGDSDHSLDISIPKNITIHGDKYVLFDFGEALITQRKVHVESIHFRMKNKIYTQHVIQLALQKITQLESTLSGESGEHLYAAMKERLRKAGEPEYVLKEIPDAGVKMLLSNIHALRQVLESVVQK
jgi:hypothetical protein